MKTYKLKLGIDLDSTLNNLDVVWLERYNNDYNDNLKHWSEWNVANCVKEECGQKIFDYLLIPKLFYDLEVQPDSVKVVNYLSKHFEIYIITAYHVSTCVDKVNWVKKYFPMINPDNIVFCNDKSILNIDYLIDDGPHNIKGFEQTGVIFNKEYNRYVKFNKNVYRCNNWNDIKKLFDEKFINKKKYLNNKSADTVTKVNPNSIKMRNVEKFLSKQVV